MSVLTDVNSKLPELAAFWEVKSSVRDQLNAIAKPWDQIGERRWQLANAALDAIDDANTAIWTYFAMDWPGAAGAQLLAVYGLFQAAVIQQDGAIELIAVALDSTYFKERKAIDAIAPMLVRNRELRDQLVGHPANKSWKTSNPSSATFIRNFRDREHLSAAIHDINSGAFRKQDIAVRDMIEVQARALSFAVSPIAIWASKPK